MKKNVMMRLASGLLVAVLLTTCAISGTFAKYVTTGSGFDTARVAKWGVTIEAAADALTGKADIFDAAYAKDDDTYSLTGVSVQATENVVAPGTKRDNVVAIAVSGTPEVAVRVSYENTVVNFGDNWKVGSEYYCPIVVKINSTEIDGATFGTIEAFEDAVKAAIVACKADYAPNADLDAVSDDVVIGWYWPFSTSTENDKKDTALGDAFNATINIKVDATVTQID